MPKAKTVKAEKPSTEQPSTEKPNTTTSVEWWGALDKPGFRETKKTR